MIRTTLKRLLDISDEEHIDGYAVEEYGYPGTTLHGIVRMALGDGEETSLEFHQQQEVTLNSGTALAIDVDGEQHTIEFFVTRALQDEDVL